LGSWQSFTAKGTLQLFIFSSCNFPVLLVEQRKQWVWLHSKKTLFTKTTGKWQGLMEAIIC
jgi:hypothetical protein